MIKMYYSIVDSGIYVSDGRNIFLVHGSLCARPEIQVTFETLYLHMDKYTLPLEDLFDKEGRPPYAEGLATITMCQHPWDYRGQFVDTPKARACFEKCDQDTFDRERSWFEGDTSVCYTYFEALDTQIKALISRDWVILRGGASDGDMLYMDRGHTRMLVSEAKCKAHKAQTGVYERTGEFVEAGNQPTEVAQFVRLWTERDDRFVKN